MKNMVLQKSFSNSTPCPSTRTFYFRKVSAPAQVLRKSRFLLTFENVSNVCLGKQRRFDHWAPWPFALLA